MNIGQLIATLGVDTTGLDQAMKEMKKFETDLKRIGDTMVKTGKKMSLFVTAPIVAAGTYSFKMAADVTEAVNKVDVAFKRDAEEVKKWSETSLKSYGMAKLTALDMVALFGDMATSMGVNTKKAADMSTRLVALAGDLASFKNIRVEVAQTALAGIFTGETESLKRLGIVMTEVNLQEFAMKQGITKRITEMNQMEKVQLRYNYILEVTKNSQGDFMRTSESAANQVRMLREGLKELSATFGEVLVPIITPVIQKLNAFLLKIKDLSDEKKKWILRIAAVAAAIGPLLIILGNLVRIIPAVTMAFRVLNLVMKSNPIILVVSAITALTAGLLLFKRRAKESMDANNDFNDSLKETETIINRRRIEEFLRSAGVLVQVQKQIAPGISIVTEVIDNTSESIEKLGMAIKALGASDLEALASIIESQIIEMKRSLEGVDLSGVLFGDLAKRRGELQNLQNALILIRQELQKISEISVFGAEGKLTVPKKLTGESTGKAGISPTFGSEGYEKFLKNFTTKMPLGEVRGVNLVMQELGAQLEFIKGLDDALGISFDENSAKIQAYQQAIEELIILGYDPMKGTIQGLKDQLETLGVVTKNTFKGVLGNINDTMQLIGSQLSALAGQYMSYLSLKEKQELDSIQKIADRQGKSAEWVAKKQEKIQKEYGEKQKRWAILQAIINGALAVTNLIATSPGSVISPATWVAIGLAGAMTASEIALISAQKFAQGGIVPPGYPNDSYPARLSSGEMVIPAQKLPDLSGMGGISEEKYESLIREQTSEIVNGILNAPVPIFEGQSIKGFMQGVNKITYRNAKFQHAKR